MQKLFLFYMVCFIIFTSCNSAEKNTNQPKVVKANTVDLKGDYCFIKTFNRDTTKVKIHVLSKDDIQGEMTIKPWEKDAAVGTIIGKLNAANEMEFLYNYMIEGSKQSETKIMKIENEKLLIKSGELIDEKNNGNLRYKDILKAVYSDTLNKISCE
jgi:hypothetical protein